MTAVMTANGGALSYTTYGAPGGFPLLFLHGTPGSRLKFASTDAPGRTQGIKIVAPDRWGYGQSAVPEPGHRTLTDFAAAMSALMTELGHNHFAVAGVSGGGPFAVAVAAAAPARVRALCLISPVGLVNEPDIPMSAFHRFCFGPLARRPRLIRALFSTYRLAVRRAPGLACGIANARAPAVDKAIMRDCTTSARLLASFSEGLSRGAMGPAVDLELFGQMDRSMAARIKSPARVIIGLADTNVPPQAAIALARAIPDAMLDIRPEAGHLWVAHNYPDIIAWIGRTVAP